MYHIVKSLNKNVKQFVDTCFTTCNYLNHTTEETIVANKELTKMMNVRTDPKALEAFHKRASELKIEPSDLIREMMSAIVDGRLRMKMGTQHKEAMEQLYYVD